MGMTYIEKLLAATAGKTVAIKPDYCVINDGVGNQAVDLLDKQQGLASKENVIVILDHDVPAGSFGTAEIQKKLIAFAKANEVRFLQAQGIGYQVLLDDYVKPGDIVVSCGKHNSAFGAIGALGLNLSVEEMAELLMRGSMNFVVPPTVKINLDGTLSKGVLGKDFMLMLLSEVGENGFTERAVEFTGKGVDVLSEAERIAICTLAGRTGAKTAFINLTPEGDYVATREYDLGEVRPMAALPGDLYTAKVINELNDVQLAACFIGGCTGGSLDDLRRAAELLKDKKVAHGTRLTISPATNQVYLSAAEEGLLEIFIDSGAQIINPGCGSCVTTSIGVIGDDETMLSSGCWNYSGCNGTEKSKVYIAASESVAASAVAGRICKA